LSRKGKLFPKIDGEGAIAIHGGGLYWGGGKANADLFRENSTAERKKILEGPSFESGSRQLGASIKWIYAKGGRRSVVYDERRRGETLVDPMQREE